MEKAQVMRAASLRSVIDGLPLSTFFDKRDLRHWAYNEFFACVACMSGPHSVAGLFDRHLQPAKTRRALWPVLTDMKDEQLKRARLFDFWFTTQKGGGTGLGFGRTYGAVNQNDCPRETSRKPAEGCAAGSIRAEEAGRSAARNPHRRKTMLLVDDAQRVRTFIFVLLREWEYSVLKAPLSEANAIAGRAGDVISVMLTDVMMPGMGGTDLASRVLPVCRCAEGSTPFTPESLARNVREAIDGQ